jgi:predicted ATP-dependent serine protease
LPRPLLHGREKTLDLIDRLIAGIEEAGSALLLSGEPGIGKTALLDCAKHRAQERRISVIAMTGILAEAHLPFAALELALRPLMKQVGLLPPRQQSALLAAFGIRDNAAPPDRRQRR